MQKELHLPDHPFSRFNNSLHEQAAVRCALSQAELYPAIQINLLLFCCWFAQAGRGRLLKQDLQQLMSAICQWHERIFKPLQQLEQQVQGRLATSLQREITAAVTRTDHIEQLFLIDVPIRFARASRNPNQKLVDACKNISLYCRLLQLPINAALSEAFSELLAAVFPKIDPREMQKVTKALLLEDSFFPQNKLALN